ncbi:ubinuclein-1-like isoform X2 [Daphnia carinata]|uniref:ubinuclein-1-like isoform X2 n=1 Tax=Daphnia carinata TaxID=120202 RepID=UPI0028694216|nr:ubinuclein-1-like isoform X2 [Daphnia carinata]
MSEPKRIALIPLAAAEAAQAPLPAKKDKKSTTTIVKTHRFTLTLPDSTEKSCPEFNFADLISALTKKKESHATNGSTPAVSTGPLLDPFAEDDEDQLRGIAKKFEEKYGLPAAKKKKSRKYDDYVDLGAGYDENDPFIDNTDAYDEIVPAEVTTAHGGFYINSGALEFKPVEKRSDSESESESESSESDSEDSLSEASTTPISTNKKRRVIESDDDDSPEEIQLNGSEGEETDVKKKKLRLDDSGNVQQAKRKKMSSPLETSVTGEASSVSSKKPRPSVKELLQQKREHEKATPDIAEKPVTKNLNNNVSVTPTAVVTTPPVPKDVLQLKRDKEREVVDLSVGSKTTPETAVVTTDSSSDSSDSSSDSSESESGGDEDEDGRDADAMKGENDPDAKLPNNLTPATLAVIEDIKKAAASSDQQGKCRFFSTEINRLLLAIELQARQYSCSKRQAIYTHLTGFLPCTKHTLLKRAKNLVLEDVESKLKPAIRKLQVSVEKVIAEQIERHATQCQRLADANPERYLEYYRYVWDPELEPAGGTDDEDKKPEKSNKTPQPRRRFQWSKEMRSILNQVVYLKAECFNWSKLRKETAAEYLLRFLDSEIRLLWPKGWMTAKILFKESQEAHSFVTSKSKLNPAVKKPSIPRSGLVDALALPSPVAPSTLSQNATNTPPSFVSKEIKKSQLKDRMSSALAQPVARQDSNSVHHRSDSAPNLSSGKAEKSRSEVNVPTIRPDNGAKLDVTKYRPRPDPTCSAARTEIHHITKDPNKSSFRQNESPHSTNHSRVTDANQTNNSKSDHPSDLVKPKIEGATSKANPVHVRSDLGIVKSDAPQSTKPNKVDSIKPRHDSNSISRGMESNKQSRSDSAASSEVKLNSVLRGPDSSKQSRWDNVSSAEVKNRFDHGQTVTKVDPAQNKVDVIPSDGNSTSNSKVGKTSKPVPTVSASLANSLASFVDSGLRWTDSIPGVLDLSDDQQQPRPTSKAAEPSTRADSHFVKDPVPKSEETEDQESLLQRDLAMVLEEISQITRLVEGKDLTQPPQMTKSSDSRTKSVIKTTGSLSTSHMPASAPSLTSNPASRSSTTSGSVLPPKLTAATRTPPPPPLVSTPVSRISSSPTGANSSVQLISPTHSSRTMSPVSSDHLKSGSGQGKYNSSISKLLLSEFMMTPPTAHSSSRHAGDFFNSGHLSPEKRKPDAISNQQSLPPLPAHQQHVSTNSIPRSSPNSINYPASSAQVVSTPTSTLAMRSSHSIESLIQTKKSPTETSSHRSVGNVHPGQQTSQSQQLAQPSVSKHDPLSIFMAQKNSQKSPHGDYNYYTQPGTGHHQQSS